MEIKRRPSQQIQPPVPTSPTPTQELGPPEQAPVPITSDILTRARAAIVKAKQVNRNYTKPRGDYCGC